MDTVTCSICGASRPPELSATLERPPCPQCGGTALMFGVSIEESISFSVQCLAELIPGNQARDWKQRWKQAQKDLQSVSSPSAETMSGESIHEWLQQLFSFFIHTYHLKDALKDAAPSLGLNASDIEAAITNDPTLALLADFANLDKHFKFTKLPRSGCVTVIEQIFGVYSASGNEWLLFVKFKDGTAIFDDLTFAKNDIDAWLDKLSSVRLL